MSSHLTNDPTNVLKFVTQFDPTEFKQLRKDKRLWDLYTVVSTIALIVVFVGTINVAWFVNLAAVFLLFPVALVALKAAKARRKLEPVAEARALVLRANALVDTWAMRDEQENAPFVVKTQQMIPVRDHARLFMVEYRDLMQKPLMFHVSSTYVGTVQGPNVTSVIDSLELAGTVTQFYDQSANDIMSHAQPVVVEEVSTTQRDAMRLQEG